MTSAIFQESYRWFVNPVSQQGNLATLDDVLLATSKAMDLLEGRPMRTGMRTAVIAGAIARILQLTQRETSAVVYAGLLHDIGLVKLVADMVPHTPPGMTVRQILQHHALLNARVTAHPSERPFSKTLLELLEQHPLAGASIVQEFGLSQDVSEIVASHHELCDGSGYPYGLSSHQIPMGARVLNFADVVEGVIADVSGLTTRQEAVENFLEVKTGDKFDSDVKAAFAHLLKEQPDFLKQLSGLEVERMIPQLLASRSLPLDGRQLLAAARTMARLSEDMIPLYKRGRHERMANLAMQIAHALGIHPAQRGELLMAALLCDMGHLGTPIEILTRPAPLTADERAIVHDHPVATKEILKTIPGFESVTLWASENHERINGKGYPGGKKGYEISVGGRILALIDVLDALTSLRPHRPQIYEPMDALPIIGQGRNTLYDSQLVSILRNVILSQDVVIR